MNFDSIVTEKRNERTAAIDRATTGEMLRIINEEDKKVALAVESVLPAIERAVDAAYEKMRGGGRMIYCGAGTSGRLGVLDASECPPTFGVDDNTVVALIAGGSEAYTKAIEGAEDDRDMGAEDLKGIGFTKDDVLVGIAASGRTPYVLGAASYAKELGAVVIALTCAGKTELSEVADIDIAPTPGPEVIAGSTRLKSGTAQKMVLNMLSTAVMIKLGKVYGNLMVDVKSTNVKLIDRAKRIVVQATGATQQEAAEALEKCGFSAKHAIIMLLCGVDSEQAREALERFEGHMTPAIEMLKQ